MNESRKIGRRVFLGLSASLVLMPSTLVEAEDMPTIQVFKSPTCGCCGMWVEHLEASGFRVKTEDVADLSPIKTMAGVPSHLMACHTGMIDGYTIEGHIPADAIRKLLAERPAIKGLAVPGMPAGSPGMPSPTPEPYDVIAFGDREDRVFMSFIETEPK